MHDAMTQTIESTFFAPKNKYILKLLFKGKGENL